MSDEVTFFVNELTTAEDKLIVVQKLGSLLDSLTDGEQIIRTELLPIFHELIITEEENALTWELAITGFPLLFKKWPRILPCLMESYVKILEHEERAIREAGLTGLGKILKDVKTSGGGATTPGGVVSSSSEQQSSDHHRHTTTTTTTADPRTVKELSGLYENLIMVSKLRNLHYGKASSADLFALIYPYLSQNARRALLPSYICLASDDHPLTRKAVAASLIKVVESASTEELSSSVYQAIIIGWKDEFIEQVRVDATTAIMRTCPKLNPEKYVVPLLNEIASDTSWRVRLSFLNNVARFMTSCSSEDIRRDLCWNNIIEMMSDNIKEVSNKAYQTVHDCTKFLNKEIYTTKVAPKIVEIMFDNSSGSGGGGGGGINHQTSNIEPRPDPPPPPLLLSSSTTTLGGGFVAGGLMSMKLGIMDRDEDACCAVCDIIIDGTDYLEKSVLLEYVGILAAHHLGCVRTRLASHMTTIVRALGQELCLSLIWALVRDRQWRVRAEITKQLPSITPLIDRNAVVKLFITTLLDLCDQVRDNAVTGIKVILQEKSTCSDGASMLPYITELLLRLWQINHGTPQAGTGETPNNSANVTNNPMLSEVLSNCAKRNIRSYIVTRTLISVITVLYQAVDPQAKTTILEDVLIPSSQDSLPNIRYVAWKNTSHLLEMEQLDPALIKPRFTAQVGIESDRDVQAILNELRNVF